MSERGAGALQAAWRTVVARSDRLWAAADAQCQGLDRGEPPSRRHAARVAGAAARLETALRELTKASREASR